VRDLAHGLGDDVERQRRLGLGVSPSVTAAAALVYVASST
jgi:hypothetical protein